MEFCFLCWAARAKSELCGQSHDLIGDFSNMQSQAWFLFHLFNSVQSQENKKQEIIFNYYYFFSFPVRFLLEDISSGWILHCKWGLNNSYFLQCNSVKIWLIDPAFLLVIWQVKEISDILYKEPKAVTLTSLLLDVKLEPLKLHAEFKQRVYVGVIMMS